MKQTTSPKSPVCPTFEERNGPRDWLHRSSPVPPTEQINLNQLAKELGVAVDRIQPLIDHGYLRVMHLSSDPATTIVARPLPGGMDWLRTMFMPLTKRPYLPVADVAAILGITERELRFICVTDNIQLSDDPVFGELLSASGFVSLKRGLVAKEDAIRFDRQTILLILAKLKRITTKGEYYRTPGEYRYSQRIENEIRRVSRLPEPQRTLRATELWAAFNEADTVTECLSDGNPAGVALRQLRSKMQTLDEKLMGTLPWDTAAANRLRWIRFRPRNQKRKTKRDASGDVSASGASPSDHQPDDTSISSESEP